MLLQPPDEPQEAPEKNNIIMAHFILIQERLVNMDHVSNVTPNYGKKPSIRIEYDFAVSQVVKNGTLMSVPHSVEIRFKNKRDCEMTLGNIHRALATLKL